MKLSERWLREWIAIDGDVHGIADALTSLGLEVDGLESLAPDVDQLVVARIDAIEPHPDADRLRVCRVNAGDGELLQVVCGAPNAREGLVSAFVRVGGRLPGMTKPLKKAKLRGVESFGMLCSASELGLSDESDGILELDASAPPGTALVDWLGLDDTVIEVDLTPDRSDCLSVRGLARDLSARLDRQLTGTVADPVAPSIDDTMPVELGEGSACVRFTGRVVRDVDMKASVPTRVVERLRRSDVRSISAGVDVTNHVMLELGQPMHAFDLDKLRGTVRARLAVAGERLELLDGRTVDLDAETTVIADDSGPIALAGIMGGAATAIDEDTTNVFLESALFLPVGINGRPRRYGCHTESSHRFERGVDPSGQREALESATALLIELAGGQAGPVIDVSQPERLPERATVTLRSARLARVLGSPIPNDEVERVLRRLGIACEAGQGGEGGEGGWSVTPPPHRWDLAIEEDYIEEVGRVHGFEALPRTLPEVSAAFRAAPETRVATLDIKRQFAHRGYQEAVTYSFVDGARQALLRPDLDALALPNPISSELGVMRTSLLTGLLDAWRYNVARQQDSVRLFETGLRFLVREDDRFITPTHGIDLQMDASVRQQSMLAGLAWGRRDRESWNGSNEPVGFFDVKADLEASCQRAGIVFERGAQPFLQPGQAASLLQDGVPVGYLGVLNPSLQGPLDLPGLPIVFELSLEAVRRTVLPAASPLSRFPSVRRDLALLVAADVEHDALIATATQAGGATLQRALVFDVYTGSNVPDGQKSIAMGLILQDVSRTLADADVEARVRDVAAALESAHGARLRDGA